MIDISTVRINCTYSTPGVVIPRRLQVSHDRAHVSNVTPAAQYRDNKVATKPYKYTEKKEPDKPNNNFVPMETTDTGCTGGNDDDELYDGQCMCICISVCVLS